MKSVGRELMVLKDAPCDFQEGGFYTFYVWHGYFSLNLYEKVVIMEE